MQAKRRDYTILETEKEHFAAWLATPQDLRRPATQKELCVVLSVSDSTLTNWSNDYRVLRRQSELMGDKVILAWPEIMDAVIATAIDSGNPKQIQAFKVLVEWYDQSQVVDEFTPEDLSSVELKELASKVYDLADEQAQSA